MAPSSATRCVGHFLLGSYQGFANYYRFAAVEATNPAHSSRAISLERSRPAQPATA